MSLLGNVAAPLFILIAGIIGGVVYFLPLIVATSRKLPNLGPIAVINVFLGWTFVGWVVSMALAAAPLPGPAPITAVYPVPYGPAWSPGPQPQGQPQPTDDSLFN